VLEFLLALIIVILIRTWQQYQRQLVFDRWVSQ